MKSRTNIRSGSETSLPSGSYLARNDDLSVLRISGRDPSGMLSAISTNSLAEGSPSVRTLLLDAKGRIQSDLLVVRDGDDLLVAANEAGIESARSILGRYAPFSKVKLEETNLAVLTLRAESAVIEGLDLPGAIISDATETEASILITGRDSVESVEHSLNDEGIYTAPEEARETARIEAATPLFGWDFTPGNFPGELGASFLESRVSFEKGCYPGQETVARMHYRGQPNKRLHRFVVESETLAGTPITQNDRDVGYLTSVAPLPVDGITYALGYLRRRADSEGELIAGEATLKVSEPNVR